MDDRSIVNSSNDVGNAQSDLTSAESQIEAKYLFIVGIGMMNWKTKV